MNALNDSDIEAEIIQLDKIIDGTNNENMILKMKKIDMAFTSMKLKCEEQCKSKYKYPWSHALKKVYFVKQFWTLWISQSKLSKKKTILILGKLGKSMLMIQQNSILMDH